MSKKKAIIGFKGLALAPVTTDTVTAYVSGTADAIPYAGSMSRTPKETSQDLYYDDDLYAQVKDTMGDDVEIRLAEMSLADIAKYGLGTFDETTNTLEANFTAKGEVFSLRCVCDTVDSLPYYFKWRIFELLNIRFDNFTTKGSSIAACEVIVTGVFKRAQLASLAPYAIMGMKDDGSNEEAMQAFLTEGETLPTV